MSSAGLTIVANVTIATLRAPRLWGHGGSLCENLFFIIWYIVEFRCTRQTLGSGALYFTHDAETFSL